MAHRIRPSRNVRASRSSYAMERMEERTLFSVAYATMVLEAPHSPALAVQVDPNTTPALPQTATLPSVLDVQLRLVSAGAYLTASVSGLDTGDPTPTGTVDFYSDAGYLGTVLLGTLSQGTAYRNLVVIPPGEHTIFAVYSGDSNFLQSQNSVERVTITPTSTLPKSTATANSFVTNTAKIKERVRPMRVLSKLSYGTVGNTALPTPRYSSVSFSVPH